MRKKVIVPLAEGFEEIEALSIVDVLRRANVDVTMAAVTSLHVKGAHGIVVVADALLKTLDSHDYDMIALPGGLPGAINLAEDATTQALLKAFDSKGKPIAAICAAPYALKIAGVLKDHYTCYPSFEVKIDHAGYTGDKKIVEDQNIITSQGPSTAMIFALKLVEILVSHEKARELEKDLLLTH